MHSIHIDNPEKNYKWFEFATKTNKMKPRSHLFTCTRNGKIIVFAGCDKSEGLFNDMYECVIDEEGISYEWNKIEYAESSQKMPCLCRHSGCLINSNTLYIIGGRSIGFSNSKDVWRFSFLNRMWERITDGIENQHNIPGLEGHSCHHLKKHDGTDCIIVYGGYMTDLASYSNNIYEFDISKNLWKEIYVRSLEETKLKPQFNARSNHAAALVNQKLYIFGGFFYSHILSDFCLYNLETYEWKSLSILNGPIERFGHSLICYENKYLVLFGGIKDIQKELNDVYVYDLEKDAWHEAEKSSLDLNIVQITKASKNMKRDGSIKKSSKKVAQQQFSTTKSLSPDKEKLKTLVESDKKSNTNSIENSLLLISAEKQSPIINEKPKESEKKKDKNNSGKKESTKIQKEKELKFKKLTMLKEFEVKTQAEKEQLRCVTPLTRTIENSLTQAKEIPGDADAKETTTFASKQRVNDETNTHSMTATTSKSTQYKIDWGGIPNHSKNEGKIYEKKPCGREGHSALVYENKMIIFGGDRFNNPFNDMYSFNLTRCIKEIKN